MSEKKNILKISKIAASGGIAAQTPFIESPALDQDDIPAAVPIEEKEEDVIAPDAEEVEDVDDGLTEEEIDPFGDKWEE